MMESKACEAASKKVRELGEDPEKYTFNEQDMGDTWRVIILPRERNIRGGGYEMSVDKASCEVSDVLYYQ